MYLLTYRDITRYMCIFPRFLPPYYTGFSGALCNLLYIRFEIHTLSCFLNKKNCNFETNIMSHCVYMICVTEQTYYHWDARSQAIWINLILIFVVRRSHALLLTVICSLSCFVCTKNPYKINTQSTKQ